MGGRRSDRDAALRSLPGALSASAGRSRRHTRLRGTRGRPPRRPRDGSRCSCCTARPGRARGAFRDEGLFPQRIDRDHHKPFARWTYAPGARLACSCGPRPGSRSHIDCRWKLVAHCRVDRGSCPIRPTARPDPEWIGRARDAHYDGGPARSAPLPSRTHSRLRVPSCRGSPRYSGSGASRLRMCDLLLGANPRSGPKHQRPYGPGAQRCGVDRFAAGPPTRLGTPREREGAGPHRCPRVPVCEDRPGGAKRP